MPRTFAYRAEPNATPYDIARAFLSNTALSGTDGVDDNLFYIGILVTFCLSGKWTDEERNETRHLNQYWYGTAEDWLGAHYASKLRVKKDGMIYTDLLDQKMLMARACQELGRRFKPMLDELANEICAANDNNWDELYDRLRIFEHKRPDVEDIHDKEIVLGLLLQAEDHCNRLAAEVTPKNWKDFLLMGGRLIACGAVCLTYFDYVMSDVHDLEAAKVAGAAPS